MRGLDAGRIAADLQAVAAEHAGKGAECRHPERGTIDRALALGQASRSVLRWYAGLSRRAVQKHQDECLLAGGGGGAGS